MFYSILFPTREQSEKPRRAEAPDYFRDLNLDRVAGSVLKGAENAALRDVFHTPLTDRDTLIYRQDVMRELEDEALRRPVDDFSKTVVGLDDELRAVRKALASDHFYENNALTRGRLLDCAERYCRAVDALAARLGAQTLLASGLRAFSDYLASYGASKAYGTLRAHVARLRQKLSGVAYCMLIRYGSLSVRKYEGQPNLAEQLIAAFDKFRQGDVRDYRQHLSQTPRAVHVEAVVLNRVAKLYPDIFRDLDDFCAHNLRFVDETLARFAREARFYLAWLDYIRPMREAGLPFNYPTLCDTADRLYVRGGFDVALAGVLLGKTVLNDFELNAPERLLVVTGPNQGGKTTFARAFGQTHHLASVGLCVPGFDASLYLFDNILTHFGREENLSTLNGKLMDDLMRLHQLLGKATPHSLIVVNEIFSSTTLCDALTLGGHMMDAFSALGAPAAIVTFLDELAARGADTVSMMSTVDAENPSVRTYRILRKPPDGLAYALLIAERRRLTYGQLVERLGS